MRYYNLVLSGGISFTSFVNGQTDPGALQIEMDVYVGPSHVVLPNSYIRIWCIPINYITQARNFAGQTISVFGGMKPGLPLSNTQPPSGLLFQGGIFWQSGNWQGTDMTLEFQLVPTPPTQPAPANFTFFWKKGTKLSTALSDTLTAALPKFKQIGISNINQNLMATEDVTHFCRTASQFGQFVNQISAAQIGGTYPGVSLVFNNQTVTAFDGTTPQKTVTLNFYDLVGQPTWVGLATVSVKTIMRADITVNDYIILPPGQVTTTPQSLSQFRQGSVFQGKFQVTQARHVGNFRSPDGNSWCTEYQAVVAQAAANG